MRRRAPCIFLGGLYRAERAIAEQVLDIAAGNLPWPDIDPGKALPWVEGNRHRCWRVTDSDRQPFEFVRYRNGLADGIPRSSGVATK